MRAGSSVPAAHSAISSVDATIPTPTPANITLATRRRSSPAAASTIAETAIIPHALAAPPTRRSAAHAGAADVTAMPSVVAVLSTRPARIVVRRPKRPASGRAEAAPTR